MWRNQEDNPLDFLDEDETGNYITNPVRLQTCVAQMRLLETKLRDKLLKIKTLEENFSESNARTQKYCSENESLKSHVNQLKHEVLDLKTREQTMNYSLGEATINYQDLLKDSNFHKSEVERMSKENLELCSKLKELELEFVKRGQTDQTIHLNMTEALKQLNKKDGLGFNENDIEENPKHLARAMSKCCSLYNFDILKIGANIDRLVFVRASDEEKVFEKSLENAKRNRTNKCQKPFDYYETNSKYFEQDSIYTYKSKTQECLPEDVISTYSNTQNTSVKPSKVLYYTPRLIVEQHLEELQTYIFQMTVSNEIEHHVLLNKSEQPFENHESEKHHVNLENHESFENDKSAKHHIEELQTLIFQMAVSNELESHVLFDKYETYFAELEFKKYHFENKANTNIKLLKQEKIEYGKLWERFCILQKQVTSSSNVSSSTEPHVTKQFFDQKVMFYKEALNGKDETIDVLQKRIDSLMVSRPCFPQDTISKIITPKTSSSEKSKEVKTLKSFIKKEKVAMTKSKDHSRKTKVTFKEEKPKSELFEIDNTCNSSFKFLVPGKSKVTIIDNSKSKVVTKSKVISNNCASVSVNKVQNAKKFLEEKAKKVKSNISNVTYMPKKTKSFTYSIPELLKFAPKQVAYLLQKVNVQTKSFKSPKKELFPNVPSIVSKTVHSTNDFVPRTPSQTHERKWIPKSPQISKINTPISKPTISKVCSPVKWNSYSLHIINTTYQWFTNKTNQSGPKMQWVPKQVKFDFAGK